MANIFLSAVNPNLDFHFFSPFNPCPRLKFHFSSHVSTNHGVRPLSCIASSKKSESESNSNSSPDPKSQRKTRTQRQKPKVPQKEDENSSPTTTPKKSRRGRKSEAAAVEDFVRDSLERTFTSIREQNPGIFENKKNILKERVGEVNDSNGSSSDGDDDDDDEGDGGNRRKKKMVVEEESQDWPLDADVGWGIRASDFFNQYPIKNVVGEDGVEIDWEGEIDDNWVKEINCLEWESFAFHPSPLIVLVFERYKRATDNWKVLKELEKAVKVYLGAKDRLPPRTVKIDINIERDLAYALKVGECPQILFCRGNKIIYREKEIRTADELVHMIAHFYYKAKKPSWISNEA